LIRPATAADSQAIAGLWDASARAGFTELLPPGHPFPEFDPARMAELLADPGVRILVADERGSLIGYTTFGTSRDADAGAGVGEVRTFFVAPTTWRRGIGSALMEPALTGLAELGYSEASLWSFADNARANAFYERHGFERDGATRTEEVWAWIPEVRYRRRLV
jgi:RimJ/RimL family protein N-acetyltransferase